MHNGLKELIKTPPRGQWIKVYRALVDIEKFLHNGYSRAAVADAMKIKRNTFYHALKTARKHAEEVGYYKPVVQPKQARPASAPARTASPPAAEKSVRGN